MFCMMHNVPIVSIQFDIALFSQVAIMISIVLNVNVFMVIGNWSDGANRGQLFIVKVGLDPLMSRIIHRLGHLQFFVIRIPNQSFFVTPRYHVAYAKFYGGATHDYRSLVTRRKGQSFMISQILVFYWSSAYFIGFVVHCKQV